MIVAGVMSGTSADGIDVALVQITGQSHKTRFQLLGHHACEYPGKVRRFILASMNSGQASVADLARLSVLLGELYGDAILAAQKSCRVAKLDLAGCHGQTLYHQGNPKPFLGKMVATTWQTGEVSRIAARLGIPVISDFRPADMSAGGQGAPLVPFLDYLLYRHPRRGRICQNLGGISNITAIPPAAAPGQVLAFDTGPGNMVIDALMLELFGKNFDDRGRVAGRGAVLQNVLAEVLRDRFFKKRPPKSAGREEFGEDFARKFIQRCGRSRNEDVIATATALTSRTIAEALHRFVPRVSRFNDYIVSGGGVRNLTLMAMLKNEVEAAGMKLRTTDDFGLPSAAKEAAAFALLAYQTWHHRSGNLPTATGARRPVILGKVSYA